MNRPFIMIVEDDVELGDIISSVLEDSGLHTETVRDGGMALDRITATEPDVILLDMHLPNVSGSEILANIRSTPKLSQTRVVITTADALLGRANEDKADLVLLKPITFDQLLNLTTRLTKTS
jgi:CheY-like chemotaxis protein